MADIESNIDININANDALATIKQLQAQISAFHTSMAKSGAASNAQLANMQQNLVNAINATGNWSASIRNVTSTAESFTNALEKNKFSMGEYFRYSMAATGKFSKFFKTEFETVEKVARERVKTLQTQYIKLGRDTGDALKAISVRPLTLDLEDMGTKTAITAQRMQILNQLVAQGSTNLLNFGKNTQWAGRQLMVGFTVPLTIFGATAAREFQKVEEQVIRLQRVYGDFSTTTQQINEMTDSIKALGIEFTKYGISVDKTIGLAADAAAMGKTGAELVTQVAEANKLAVLGGVDQQKSLETTISLTNAFGVAADQLSGKIDFLNAVENQTVTSIDDLTTAIPTAGPVIQQLGGNVEDLTFLLTAMREGGINASEGANALKSGLASLINPTGEASDMLAGFGINIKGIVEANKGDVKGTVVGFAKALDTLDPLNRAQAIEQLFGKFQFSRLSTLFQNVIAEGSQANRVLQLTASSSEQLAILSEREMKRIEDSPLYKFQSAVERFQAALAPVGEQFLKAVTPIIDFGTDLLNSFNGWSEQAKNFTMVFAGIAGAVAPVALMAFGLVANGVANLLKLFRFLAGAFTGAGKQSGILGEQLDYMSQQQLESAAIAASLEQVHQTLVQTFTSEATAVGRLAREYQNATAQQERMMGGSLTPKRGAKKMATGGIVPGTGNGDTVPAMLTPGEFVLTKDVVNRYPGLIAQMMSGKIQAFETGGLVHGHLQQELNTNNKGVASQMESLYPGWSQLSRKQQGLFQVSGSLTASIGSQLNQDLRDSAGGVISGAFLDAWNAVDDKLMSTARMAGVGQHTAIIKEIEDGIGRRAVELAGAGGKVTDSILSQATQEVLAETKGRGGKYKTVATALQKRASTVGDVRSRPSRGGANRNSVNKKMLEAGLADGSMVLASDGNIYFTGADGKAIPGTPPVGRLSASKGAKQTTQYTAGGYRTKHDATVVDSGKAMLTRGGSVPVEEENVKAKRDNTKAVKKQTAKVIFSAEEQERYDRLNKQERTAMTRAKKKLMAGNSNLTDLEHSAMYGALSQETPKPKTGRPGIFGGKLAVGAAGASGALFAASMMGGPVGDLAGSVAGPMMAFSMLQPLLAKMPAPIQAATVALGALAAVGIGLKDTFDKAQRSAEEFAQTTGASNQAIENLAEITGNVTSGSIMAKKRQGAFEAITPTEEQSAMVQEYLASEIGKKTVSSIADQMKGSGGQIAAQNFAAQMSTAIATGAISAGDAGELIRGIGKELGDTTFAVKVDAEMTKLVGFSGEDLKKDPLNARVSLVENAGRSLASSGDSLKNLQIGSTGVATGMAAGAIAGSIIPGVGTALGAGLGGVAGGIVDMFDYFNRLGAASGAFASNITIAQQQSQQLLDSLELQAQNEIAKARAAGDYVKATELQLKYEQDRKTLLESTAKLQQDAANTYSGLSSEQKTSVIGSLDQQIKDRYKDGAQRALAENAISQIGSATVDGSTAEMQLKGVVASGDVPPQMMTNLIGMLTSNDKSVDVAANIVTKLGAGGILRVSQIADLLGGKEGADFTVNIEAKGSKEATDILDAMERIGKHGGQAGLKKASEWLKTDQGTAKINGLIKQYNALDKMLEKGPITMKAVVDYDPKAFSQLQANAAWFDSLPAAAQKFFLENFVTVFATVDDKDVASWMAKKKNLSSTSGIKVTAEDKAQYAMEQVQAATDTAKASGIWDVPVQDQQDNTGGGGGGGAAPRTFADVVGDQKKRTDDINNQVVAVRKLVAAGLSLADAYAAASNAEDAALIANQDNADALRELADRTREAEQATKDFAASQSVVASNQDVIDKKALISRLASDANLTNTQRGAILGDSNLATLYMNPGINPDALTQALRNAEQQADLDLNIKKLTLDGLEDIFQNGFDKAMEAFAAREQAIEVKFKAKTDPFNEIVKKAQQTIEDLTNRPGGLEDMNAELQRIADKEKIINDSYAERQRALDRVKASQQTILNQQRAQLTVADALTQGDISAAARAVQDQRAQAASDALANQQTIMDSARQLELDSLTATMGLTRKQLEEQILAMKTRIFEIEQQTIQPAQRQIALLDRQKQLELEALTVLGKTKQEWQNIKLKIDLAKTSSDKYTRAMEQALSVVDDIIAGWVELEKPKSTTYTVYEQKVILPTIDQSGGSPAGTGGPSVVPDRVDNPTGTPGTSLNDVTSTGDTSAKSLKSRYDKAMNKMSSGGGYAAIPYMNQLKYAYTQYLNSPMGLQGARASALGQQLTKLGFNRGGFVPGYGLKDKISATLTPGEFVVNRAAVDAFGASNLAAINNGKYDSGSMYNNTYSISVNVKSDANPDQIARTVVDQIKQVDAQRVRGNRF